MVSIQLIKRLFSAEGEIQLNVKLNIEKNSFVSVFGKSGAGKTTLLKMLAGLVEPDKGIISVDQELWYDSSKRINKKPQQREIGFVFQDYALFPNMTVRQNLEFVNPEKKNTKYLDELLDIMGLTNLASRYPTTLSGGQQQRVALARALVRKPKLLLLDEPLSSLDHEMRLRLQEEITKIHRTFKLTTILISHEPSEIYRLSDHIYELEQGKVIRQGSPSALFEHGEITGKMQFTGEIIELTAQDVVYVLTIISANRIIKVVITKDQATELKVGDKVLVSTKAFNPLIFKLR